MPETKRRFPSFRRASASRAGIIGAIFAQQAPPAPSRPRLRRPAHRADALTRMTLESLGQRAEQRDRVDPGTEYAREGVTALLQPERCGLDVELRGVEARVHLL